MALVARLKSRVSRGTSLWAEGPKQTQVPLDWSAWGELERKVHCVGQTTPCQLPTCCLVKPSTPGFFKLLLVPHCLPPSSSMRQPVPDVATPSFAHLPEPCLVPQLDMAPRNSRGGPTRVCGYSNRTAGGAQWSLKRWRLEAIPQQGPKGLDSGASEALKCWQRLFSSLCGLAFRS